MRRLLYAAAMIFLIELFLLICPLTFFLIGLSLGQELAYDAFRWVYPILLLFSAFFSVRIGLACASQYHSTSQPLILFSIHGLGFLPLGYFLLTLGGLWNIRNFIAILSVPVILGSISVLLLLLPCPSQKHT